MYIYLLLALNTLLHNVWQRPERGGRRVVLLLLLLLLLMTLVVLLRDYRPHESARLRHPGLRSHLRLLSAPRVRRGPGQFNRGFLRGDAGVSGGIPRRISAVQRRGPSVGVFTLSFVTREIVRSHLVDRIMLSRRECAFHDYYMNVCDAMGSSRAFGERKGITCRIQRQIIITAN